MTESSLFARCPNLPLFDGSRAGVAGLQAPEDAGRDIAPTMEEFAGRGSSHRGRG